MKRRSTTIKRLTLRGIDQDLERSIRELAEPEGLSLNQAVICLLRRGAGLSDDSAGHKVGNSLDQFFGRWTKEEADEFDRSMQEFERIDGAL